ncbi:MAG: radical SAM protein, partial [Planctomycetota bacterium]
GIHLAALTPRRHDVRVLHQQVEPVQLETDADLVCLTFFSGFAEEAYRLADAFRARGKTVVVGGPHVTFWPDEAADHADSVVIGEAESVWEGLLLDAEDGKLQPRYVGEARPMEGLPTPRYDLLSDRFVVRRVVQATRGCPYTCSFCTVPGLQPGFRVRPVEEVLADVRYEEPGWNRWQRKVVWFWDDNLTVKRRWVKELLRGMIGLDRWWLTQASIDIVKDEELLDLMQQSGCIGIFLGIESLKSASLVEAGKRQNRVEDYRAAVDALHARGICVMAGFIAGFDNDDAEGIVDMADQMQAIGIDVPFLSVLTPFRGTPLFDKLEGEGRLRDVEWGHTNGYNVAFEPERMSAEELLAAHRKLWRRAFGPKRTAARLARARKLRPGAAMMSLTMNGFYGWKGLTGNLPRTAG